LRYELRQVSKPKGMAGQVEIVWPTAELYAIKWMSPFGANIPPEKRAVEISE